MYVLVSVSGFAVYRGLDRVVSGTGDKNVEERELGIIFSFKGELNAGVLFVKMLEKGGRFIIWRKDNKGVINLPEPAGWFDGRGAEGF